jgi:hypothetical protein
MKIVGFSIANDCIGIERGSDYFDLHNNYDFQGLSYNVVDRTIELFWCRGTGDWIKLTDPTALRLVFSNVHLFKAHERDAALPFTEDDCLDSIGFFWDEMLPEMQGYSSNMPKEGCTHLNATFVSGFSVKIGAESVCLHTEEAPNNSFKPMPLRGTA